MHSALRQGGRQHGVRWAHVLVHGGAWAIPDHLDRASVLGCRTAAAAGLTALHGSGGVLAAVEAAVRSLEDDPAFDAGTGSVLNAEGEVEMDAIICDGELRAGAVAGVRNIRNPVSLARLVMERTDHVLLVGAGADQFAKEQGVPTVPTSELVTPEATAQFEEHRRYQSSVATLFNNQMAHDTVGAVAVDDDGNVAAATSTGGITAKRVGRVGDSPILGSGAFADNEWGAVSCTGHGEAIMKAVLARSVGFELERGGGASAAVVRALESMRTRLGGCGGVILVTTEGDVALHHTTEKMAWGLASTGAEIQAGIRGYM